MPDGKKQVTELGFVPKAPVGVVALACNPEKTLVAVCRANGSLEMWRVKSDERPYLWRERVTAARKGATYRGIVWVDADTFVVATLGGQLIAHDAATLEVQSVTSSHGGAIWAMDIDPERETVAIACDDGRVRFFSVQTAGDDLLTLQPRNTTMVRAKAKRALSVRFGAKGSRVYFGDDAGVLVCAAVKDGRTVWETELTTRLQTFTSKKRMKQGPVPAIAWTVAEVENSVVAGTSTGEVKVVDPHSGVLLQSLRTHKADILTMCPVDDIICISGVDNILATLQQWESEWVKSEGRNWGSCDVTSMALLDHGLLVTGSLDGFLVVCETREMFPAKAGTGKASVLHVHQPFRQHTHAFRDGQMIASVEDYAITLHRIPQEDGKKEKKEEVVAELRYEVEGVSGIDAFAVDNAGRAMAYATRERTRVVGLEGEEPETLLEGEGEEHKTLPPATSLCFHGDTLYAAHDQGILAVADIFSTPAQPTPLPDAPSASFKLISSPAGHLACCSPHGSLTLLSPHHPTSKKRKTTGDPSPLTVSWTRTLKTEIRDIAFCTVQGKLSVFVLLLDGKIGAYTVDGNEPVWGRDKMPSLGYHSRAQWCSGDGDTVVLASHDWFAVLDMASSGYTHTRRVRLYDRCRKDTQPGEAGMLLVFTHALQGAHVTSSGTSLSLINAPLEKLLEAVPPCFWRKQYGT